MDTNDSQQGRRRSLPHFYCYLLYLFQTLSYNGDGIPLRGRLEG